VSVVVITDGRFDPRDDDSLLTYLCDDPSVDVNAIGVGDMFGREGQHESLESIACQRHDRVTGMTRFADLVADNFIDRMESVLCPGETIIDINVSPKARDGVLRHVNIGLPSGAAVYDTASQCLRRHYRLRFDPGLCHSRPRSGDP
jgi:hypothetical protein